MANKEMVKGLLIRFCEVYAKELTQSLQDSFFAVLKDYSDKQIQEAGYKCLEDLDYMPKPSQVVARLPKASDNKHNAELRKRFTCPACGDYVTMIVEGSCWNCYSGIPRAVRPKWHWDVPKEDRDFKISQGVRCKVCGTIGLCIKEPTETGDWKCRVCYSGISREETQARFKTLRVISKTGFPPNVTTPGARFEYIKGRARELMGG